MLSGTSETDPMKTNFPWLPMVKLVAALGLFLPAMSGCMVGPDYSRPHMTVPADWASSADSPTLQSTAPSGGRPDLILWWRQFNDPLLTALVEEAVRVNLDLKIAEARLRQARASRDVTFGGLWPAVNASAGYQRKHTAGAANDKDIFQAGLDAAWELDLFGGRRRGLEAADAGTEAAGENIRDVQVSLVAEVALNYIQLRGYQQQILVARKNLDAQRKGADIARKLFGAGFDTALDVASADAAVATTEAQIPVYETGARQAIHALSVLLARPPADLLKQLSSPSSLPRVPSAVPAGLPSDLLRQRPDIREAEAQLHAATAQVGVATADFFPSFSLTGSLNWNSNLLRTWWNEASRSFGAGPSVTWPIFQGGAIAANVRLQKALRDQAYIAYRKTVLSAFQDVENALIAFAKEQQHQRDLNEAVTANRKLVDLSLALYSEGQNNFLTVITAQQSLYSAENALVQSNGSLAADLIALYKALGGGGEPLSKEYSP